jgi:nucleoside-diphosphate-sugar epimerase
MRVLVIGGTEFIGRRIVERLVERGDDVLLVHRGQTEPAPVLGTHRHVDRRDFGSVAGEVRAFRPDAVVDCVALTAADVTAVLPHLPDTHLVVLSSLDVYRAFELLTGDGTAVPVPFDEDGPLREGRYPHRGRDRPGFDDYEKLHVEPPYLARGGTVLRLGMVHGPRDPQRREEPVLRRVRAGRTRIPVGPAATLLPRLHVDDAASAVLATLGRPAATAGQVFNLAERASWPVGTWMRAVLAAAGHEADLVRVPDRLLPADLRLTRTIAQHLLLSSEKAVRVLDWHPIDTAAATIDSVRWHLANPPPDSDFDADADDTALAHAIVD